MRRFALLPLLAIPFVLAGCASQPSVAGTWQVTGLESLMQGAGTADIKMKFEQGGEATMTVDATMPLPGGETNLTIHTTLTGTYDYAVEESGSSIKFTATDADLKIDGMENLPPQAQTLFDSQKEQVIADNNKLPAMKIEWQGPDKFLAKAQDGTTATFTRIE